MSALTPGAQEGSIDEQIARGYVSPLDFIQVENISRSKIFSNEFFTSKFNHTGNDTF